MNRSYVSPTKLSCLALVCLVSILVNAFNSFIVCMIASAGFVFAIAIVSNLERVASNHVRFIIYALIMSAIFTIIKIVFGYINSIELYSIAEELEYGFLASLVLAVLPIYFMHKESSKDYYLKTVYTACALSIGGVVIASVMELINYGSIFGFILFDSKPSVLGSSFVTFILIAIFAVIGTAFENYVSNKRREKRLLIDKYKFMIRQHQLAKIRNQKLSEQKSKDKEGNE